MDHMEMMRARRREVLSASHMRKQVQVHNAEQTNAKKRVKVLEEINEELHHQLELAKQNTADSSVPSPASSPSRRCYTDDEIRVAQTVYTASPTAFNLVRELGVLASPFPSVKTLQRSL